MLRDLSRLSGGMGVLGTHLVGVLASELPTGFALPGLLNNDVASGDPAGCLYRVEILPSDRPASGVLALEENGAFSLTGAVDGIYTGAETVYKNDVAEAGSYSMRIGATTPPDNGGSTYATHILETFETRAGVPRVNLAGMRWYVFAQVAPAPLGAPIAQGIAETTDGAGAALFDISGQTSVLPGARVTLAFTNSNGDPDQVDLISWFGTVSVY